MFLSRLSRLLFSFFFFFNDTATTEIYTLSLHDALPIYTYVAIDVLEKQGDGYHLTEVKSSSSLKDEHIPDVAIQARVAAACDVKITAAAVLHLNKEFRHPASGDLFVRTDVTAPVVEFLPRVPDEIDRQREMLAGPLPDVPVGLHCFEPYKCPFMARCWPDTP